MIASRGHSTPLRLRLPHHDYVTDNPLPRLINHYCPHLFLITLFSSAYKVCSLCHSLQGSICCCTAFLSISLVSCILVFGLSTCLWITCLPLFLAFCLFVCLFGLAACVLTCCLYIRLCVWIVPSIKAAFGSPTL